MLHCQNGISLFNQLDGKIFFTNHLKSEWEAMDEDNEKFPLFRKYLINTKSIDVIKESPGIFACPERENKVSWKIDKNREAGLYSWITPALPEDLTFYTASGDIWLMSISHEEEAYFNDSIVNPEIIKNYLG